MIRIDNVKEIVKKVRPHIEAVAFHCYEGDYKAPGALNQVICLSALHVVKTSSMLLVFFMTPWISEVFMYQNRR